jgi:hypothetical protein
MSSLPAKPVGRCCHDPTSYHSTLVATCLGYNTPCRCKQCGSHGVRCVYCDKLGNVDTDRKEVIERTEVKSDVTVSVSSSSSTETCQHDPILPNCSLDITTSINPNRMHIQCKVCKAETENPPPKKSRHTANNNNKKRKKEEELPTPSIPTSTHSLP